MFDFPLKCPIGQVQKPNKEKFSHVLESSEIRNSPAFSGRPNPVSLKRFTHFEHRVHVDGPAVWSIAVEHGACGLSSFPTPTEGWVRSGEQLCHLPGAWAP